MEFLSTSEMVGNDNYPKTLVAGVYDLLLQYKCVPYNDFVKKSTSMHSVGQ